MSPFKSEAQRKFMFKKHPEIAKKWAEKYGMSEDMPEHAGKKEKQLEALKSKLKK